MYMKMSGAVPSARPRFGASNLLARFTVRCMLLKLCWGLPTQEYTSQSISGPANVLKLPPAPLPSMAS